MIEFDVTIDPILYCFVYNVDLELKNVANHSRSKLIV